MKLCLQYRLLFKQNRAIGREVSGLRIVVGGEEGMCGREGWEERGGVGFKEVPLTFIPASGPELY